MRQQGLAVALATLGELGLDGGDAEDPAGPLGGGHPQPPHAACGAAQEREQQRVRPPGRWRIGRPRRQGLGGEEDGAGFGRREDGGVTGVQHDAGGYHVEVGRVDRVRSALGFR